MGNTFTDTYGGGGNTFSATHGGNTFSNTYGSPPSGGGSGGAVHHASGGSSFLGGVFGDVAHAVETAVHPVSTPLNWYEKNVQTPAQNEATQFTLGVGELAKIVGEDFYNTWRHPSLQPNKNNSHFYNDVVVPQAKDVSHKFSPIAEHPLTGKSYHPVESDPFGTALDLLSAGTIPFGGEGVAIKGANVADRLGMTDTVIGRAFVNAANRAHAARAPYDVAYTPNEGVGGVFKADRARTVQGRYIYNPIREAVGRTLGGSIPYVGNAARFNRSVDQAVNIGLGPDYAMLRAYDSAIGANVRKAKRLTPGERVALDVIPGYGPKAAQAAELGVPRQQLLDFYTKKLVLTRQALAGDLSRATRTEAKVVEHALSIKVKLLTKNAAEIDQAIKNPRPIMAQVTEQAKHVADSMGQWMIDAHLATPETVAERPLLEQKLLGGAEFSEGRTLGYEQAQPNYAARRAGYNDALAARDALPAAETAVAPGLFHGTRERFANDTPGDIYSTGSGAGNLYGHGFYTTDAHDVASTYTRKGGATEDRFVYRTEWTGKGQPKLLNLDEPAHPTVKKWGEAQLRQADIGGFDMTVESYDALKETLRSGSSGEVIRAVRRMWASTGEIPKSEVDDMVSVLSEQLAAQGFDGLKHVGGVLAGGGKTPHNVSIFFDPNKLKLSPANVEQVATTAPLEKAREDLRTARTQPGAKRAIKQEPGFYGGTIPFDQIPLEHPDAFYRPHSGPEIKNREGRFQPGASGVGAPKVPGESKLNRGYRYSTGRTESGPQVWTRAGLHVMRFRAIRMTLQRYKDVMVPYDGLTGSAPLREGYGPVNIRFDEHGGIVPRSLTRGQKEAPEHDENLLSLTPAQEHKQLTDELNSMFPAESRDHVVATYQMPLRDIKKIKGDYKRSNIVIRNLVDKPLAVWKALVLKNRPAWLVNNLFGQHVLLLLHNGLQWQNYLAAQNPRVRREFEDALPGLSMQGTSNLARGSARFGEHAGPMSAGYYGRGAQAVALTGHGAGRVFNAWGDGIAKLNQELADNVPRTTLAIKYVKEKRNALRHLEIANGAVESAVKGKTLAEVARDLSQDDKAEILRKVNRYLGDFGSMSGSSARVIRRVLPFATWFKVIMQITADLTLDHPEKLLFFHALEAAGAKDPGLAPAMNTLPSWYQGSLNAPVVPGQSQPGTQGMLSTQAINPFQTPVQLGQQVASLFKSGTPGGSDNPVASLGPLAEMYNLSQNIDPFFGGAYQGPGQKQSPVVRSLAGVLFGLPETRLLQQGGIAPYYQAPKSYHDTYVDVNGHQVPLDALLRYLGYPLRRIDTAASAKYAREGR